MRIILSHMNSYENRGFRGKRRRRGVRLGVSKGPKKFSVCLKTRSWKVDEFSSSSSSWHHDFLRHYIHICVGGVINVYCESWCERVNWWISVLDSGRDVLVTKRSSSRKLRPSLKWRLLPPFLTLCLCKCAATNDKDAQTWDINWSRFLANWVDIPMLC